MSDFLSNLKAGDEVAVVGGGAFATPEIVTVAKRTPSGLIVLGDGRRFNPDGYERGATYRGRRRLAAPDKGVREKILRAKLVSLISQKLHRPENLDTPTLKRVAAAIGGGA